MGWILIFLGHASRVTAKWIREQWRWLVAGGVLLLSFFLGSRLLSSLWEGKKPGVKEEEAARQQVERIEEEAVARKKEIVADAEEKRSDEVDAESAALLDIGDDTEAVNDYLRDVGEDMRK
jgi:hypothetical protein